MGQLQSSCAGTPTAYVEAASPSGWPLRRSSCQESMVETTIDRMAPAAKSGERSQAGEGLPFVACVQSTEALCQAGRRCGAAEWLSGVAALRLDAESASIL